MAPSCLDKSSRQPAENHHTTAWLVRPVMGMGLATFCDMCSLKQSKLMPLKDIRNFELVALPHHDYPHLYNYLVK